jgi:hypothetical protein
MLKTFFLSLILLMKELESLRIFDWAALTAKLGVYPELVIAKVFLGVN